MLRKNCVCLSKNCIINFLRVENKFKVEKIEIKILLCCKSEKIAVIFFVKNWDFEFLQILIKEFYRVSSSSFLESQGICVKRGSSFLVKSIKSNVIPESIIVTICPSGSIRCPSSVHQVLPFVHQVPLLCSI